ncbi:MAG: peptide-methionine (S)-S-oxide reductase MsrA [Anaerolineae bacterium]|nr:peptide-methionine (S)-S-oxide reductase MsrA [Anaerolineae bacterium]
MTSQTSSSGSGANLQIATLAGGCFWCLEAVFDQVIGVTDVVSGYAGGHAANPTYQQVCTGNTGHAEVVQVTFDPAVIDFADLLRIFFAIHDPTTLNRQGADVGTQYRSAIFYHDEAQKAAAEAVIEELVDEKLWHDPIVTELVPLQAFYPAEDYHQEYFANNPGQGYCQFVVAPKVAKFRQKFQHRLKA